MFFYLAILDTFFSIFLWHSSQNTRMLNFYQSCVITSLCPSTYARFDCKPSKTTSRFSNGFEHEVTARQVEISYANLLSGLLVQASRL